jgi:hypothetical protein
MNANFAAVASKVNGNILQDSFGTFTGVVTWSISSNVLAQSVSSSSTEGVVSISATGVLGSGKSGIKLTSAAAQTTGDAGLYVYFSSASTTIPAALFQSAGTGRVLKVVSTTAPSIPAPVMNTTQRDAVTGAAGDQIYNSTLKRPEFHDGTAWRGANIYQVVSKTSAYTATGNDDVILADTASAWQLDLPAAASHAGKIYRIVKTTSDFNALTIEPNSSETIGGSANTTLNTSGESLEIISDGSNWQILRRHIPSTYTSYTPTWSNLGAGSITTTANWFRSGRNLLVRFHAIKSGGAGSGAVVVTMSLPTGLSINTTVSPTDTAFGAVNTYSIAAATQYGITTCLRASTTAVHFTNNGTAGFYTGADFRADCGIGGLISIPISGWND